MAGFFVMMNILKLKAKARAIPLLREVEGCVNRLHNTPLQPHSLSRPLSRGDFKFIY
jgi:hypothetical protein